MSSIAAFEEAQRYGHLDASRMILEVKRQQQELKSSCGMDYRKLRDLLAAGKWEEADQETSSVMLKASGREKTHYFNSYAIDNFPCTDLRTIDQLWVNYSDGRFGFSVQKQVYLSVSGKSEYSEDINSYFKFFDLVVERERKRAVLERQEVIKRRAALGL